MTEINAPDNIKALLVQLSYNEEMTRDILGELELLFKEIEFGKFMQSAASILKAEDPAGLISLLKDLMASLETKEFYRPDYPHPLLKLLVNGQNICREDIFKVLGNAAIPASEKNIKKESLASCAAITQLGYILITGLGLRVRPASAGPHVFLIADGFSPDSMIFIDFSLELIREADVRAYCSMGDFYQIKDSDGCAGPHRDTSGLPGQYYLFFMVKFGIGLNHNILNNIGIVYDTAGKYEKAVRTVEKALNIAPDYIEARNNLAVIYEELGDYEAAIRELETVIRQNPGSVEAYFNLGHIYASQKRYDGAIKTLLKALDLNPGYAPAHNTLGDVYAVQNRTEEAIGEFKQAIKSDPDFAFAHNNLGHVYSELERNEEAEAEFMKAIDLVPEFVEANYGIGLVYCRMRKYEKAAHYLVGAVSQKPELIESVPDNLRIKVTQGL